MTNPVKEKAISWICWAVRAAIGPEAVDAPETKREAEEKTLLEEGRGPKKIASTPKKMKQRTWPEIEQLMIAWGLVSVDTTGM